MGTEDQFRIELGPLQFERGTSPSPYDRLLGIQATLRMTVLGREWFKEDAFPVVELAAAVNSWLIRGGDFEFETAEAEEAPFFWVRSVGSGCLVGAAWQAFAVLEPLPCDLLREELARFARELVVSVKEQLDVEVEDLLSEQAG